MSEKSTSIKATSSILDTLSAKLPGLLPIAMAIIAAVLGLVLLIFGILAAIAGSENLFEPAGSSNIQQDEKGKSQQAKPQNPITSERAQISLPSGEKLTTEIADTAEERRIGLMNRTELETDGMLFVFEQEAKASFWMKDTLIPLDILFIGKDGIITDIYENAEPRNTEKTYQSSKSVLYALEIEGGRNKLLRLKPGDKLQIS
jgi:uncharacterized membrane protein (UPF0127 family)